MKKSILYGTLTAAICFFLGLFVDFSLAFSYIAGAIGLGSLMISGILSGAFVSGERVRSNYWTESKEDRSKRIEVMVRLALFGLPNFAVAVALYMV